MERRLLRRWIERVELEALLPCWVIPEDAVALVRDEVEGSTEVEQRSVDPIRVRRARRWIRDTNFLLSGTARNCFEITG